MPTLIGHKLTDPSALSLSPVAGQKIRHKPRDNENRYARVEFLPTGYAGYCTPRGDRFIIRNEETEEVVFDSDEKPKLSMPKRLNLYRDACMLLCAVREAKEEVVG